MDACKLIWMHMGWIRSSSLGGETDVCVLATVLAAIDIGYRVIVAEDALCSSSAQSHHALLQLYAERFSIQIEVTPTADILRVWTVQD
ncbi:isochorismatase family protein [Bradyrhizobium sp. CCBAU 53421]|uniref:isochorismatase family protein n=1 Tax=Bradyrhizobium sp. CCBAU 53421 TaxID=1325120 RepID=UPI0035300227